MGLPQARRATFNLVLLVHHLDTLYIGRVGGCFLDIETPDGFGGCLELIGTMLPEFEIRSFQCVHHWLMK